VKVGGSPAVARPGPAHVTAVGAASAPQLPAGAKLALGAAPLVRPRSDLVQRPRRAVQWSCALAVWAALTACSPKGPADAGQIPLAQLGSRVAAAACACIMEGDGGAPYCNLADCKAAFPQLGLATLALEVDGGFLAYDPFAAAICLAESGAFCFTSALGLPASVEATAACPRSPASPPTLGPRLRPC